MDRTSTAAIIDTTLHIITLVIILAITLAITLTITLTIMPVIMAVADIMEGITRSLA